MHRSLLATSTWVLLLCLLAGAPSLSNAAFVLVLEHDTGTSAQTAFVSALVMDALCPRGLTQARFCSAEGALAAFDACLAAVLSTGSAPPVAPTASLQEVPAPCDAGSTSQPCPVPSCNWYADCLEDVFQCGPAGYPRGYGLRYCTAFRLAADMFSPAGRSWIDRTTACLQDALSPWMIGLEGRCVSLHVAAPPGAGRTGRPRSWKCHSLQMFAFRTHAACYVRSGFCEMVRKHPSDLRALFHVLHWRDILFLHPPTASDRDAVWDAEDRLLPLWQAISVARHCVFGPDDPGDGSG